MDEALKHEIAERDARRARGNQLIPRADAVRGDRAREPEPQ